MTDEQIQNLPGLREEQRIEAKDKARQNLMARLGGEPRFEDFERREVRKVGPWMEGIAITFLGLLFLFSFIASASHVYMTAHEVTMVSQHNPTLAFVLGVAFVAMAESAILGLSLATSAIEMPGPIQGLIWLGVSGAAFVTAIGNINAVIFYHPDPFNWVTEWLEALGTKPQAWGMATVPPAFTVILGVVLKFYATDKAKGRQQAKNKYEEAMRGWEQITAQIEQRPDWQQTYANALWDIWRKGRRAEVVAAITPEMKIAIVQREMMADQWFHTGPFTEISLKTQKSTGENVTGQVDRVVDYFKNNPAAKDLKGLEIAEMLGVSEATVSRARARLLRNGHGG